MKISSVMKVHVAMVLIVAFQMNTHAKHLTVVIGMETKVHYSVMILMIVMIGQEVHVALVTQIGIVIIISLSITIQM